MSGGSNMPIRSRETNLAFTCREDIALGVEILYRILNTGEMTITEHDDPYWVDRTWDFGLNLSGINILLGLNISI